MKALRLVLITSMCILMALAAKAQVKIGENPLNTSPSHWLEIEQSDSFFIVTDDLSIGITDNPHRGSAPAPNVDALMLKLYGYGLNNFLPSATSPFIQDSEPLGGITSNIFAGITEDGYLMEVPLKLVIEVADSSQADLSFYNGVDTFGTTDLMALDSIFATDNELRDSTALLRTLINNSEIADHDTITGNEFIDSIRLSNDTLYFIENLAGRLAPSNTQSIDLGPLINGTTFYFADGSLDESRTVDGATFDLTYTNINDLLESSVTNTTTTTGDQTLESTGGDIIVSAADSIGISSTNDISVESSTGDISIDAFRDATLSSTSQTTINGNQIAIQQGGEDIMQINSNHETKFLSPTVDTILLLDDDGSISMEAYGDSMIIGDVSTILAVDADGNMIEIGITDILASDADSTIYTHDGTLTGARVLTGNSNDLTYTGVGVLTESSTTSVSTTTARNTLESTGGDIAIIANGEIDADANIVTIDATTNSTLTSGGDNSIESTGGDVVVTANGALDLNAPVTTINDSLRLEGYGDTTYTGTFTTILGSDADGNVIELTASEILGTETDSVIYRHDGTLTGDRVLDGAAGAFDLSFNQIDSLTESSRTSLSTTTGENTIQSTNGDVSIEADDDANIGAANVNVNSGGSFTAAIDDVTSITSGSEIMITSNTSDVLLDANTKVGLIAPVTTINDSLRLEGYGDTTYTGTFTTILGSDADGNVIELTASEILGTETDSVIYRHDGTLTGDRVLDGAGGVHDLTFTDIDALTESSVTSLSTTTGDNNIETTGGDVNIFSFDNVNIEAVDTLDAFGVEVKIVGEDGVSIIADNTNVEIAAVADVEISADQNVMLNAFAVLDLNTPVTTISDSLRLEGYGDTTYTGTFTTILGSDADGNVIELTASEILGTETDSVIYRHDGTLTDDRVLSGAGNDLTFEGIDSLVNNSTTSVSTTTSDNTIESTAGNVIVNADGGVYVDATGDGVYLNAPEIYVTAADEARISATGVELLGSDDVSIQAPVTTINDSLRLEGYGDTTYTGTFTTILGSDADGNVIELTASEILGTETDSVIYRHDGTLTGDRVLSGAGNDLTFTGIDSLVNSSTTSTILSTGDNTIESTGGDVEINAIDEVFIFALDTMNVHGEEHVTITSEAEILIHGADLVTIDGGSADVLVGNREVEINTTHGFVGGELDINSLVTTISDSLRLEGYGDTTYTGTFTTILGSDIDGNVIELTADQILGTESDSTIYTHNGTLTQERTMTMGQLATPHNLFFVSPDGADTTVIAPDGRVGISTGSFTPNSSQSDVKLEVNGDILAIKVHSSSDRRFKKNISPIASALEKVMSIEGVTYDFRKEEFLNRNFPTGTQVGFIAQNVETVLPEVVITNGDGYKAVDYSKITALLNEAIKEQQAQITQLQERLNASSELNASLVDEIAAIKNMIKEISHLADSDED